MVILCLYHARRDKWNEESQWVLMKRSLWNKSAVLLGFEKERSSKVLPQMTWASELNPSPLTQRRLEASGGCAKAADADHGGQHQGGVEDEPRSDEGQTLEAVEIACQAVPAWFHRWSETTRASDFLWSRWSSWELGALRWRQGPPVNYTSSWCSDFSPTVRSWGSCPIPYICSKRAG